MQPTAFDLLKNLHLNFNLQICFQMANEAAEFQLLVSSRSRGARPVPFVFGSDTLLNLEQNFVFSSIGRRLL